METGTLYTTSLQRSRSSILPHLTFPAHQPDSAGTAPPDGGRTGNPGQDPKLAEDVVEGHGLQVAAVDDVEQLGVAVADGGQVGVGDHDLLGLKRFPGVADEAVFVLRSRVPDVTAPHGDRGVPQIGGQVWLAI